MKIMISCIFSLMLHAVLIMPISAKNKISTQVASKLAKSKLTTLKIHKMEIVPSKVVEQMIETSKKTFHGKPKKIKQKAVNTNSGKDNPVVDEYLKVVRNTIIKHYVVSKKAKKMKLKGKAMAKIQIQRSGIYDVLFVSAEHPLLQKLTEQTLEKISRFAPIPKGSGQQEIQLKIPLVFDFSK